MREIISFIVKILNDEEIDYYRKLFLQLDSDSKGYLILDDLKGELSEL